MFAEKEVAAPAPSINTDPIFVAIEMSRSKWVVGTHIPTSSKVGIHTVEWGDAAALLALVERLRSRAADVVGIADVPVLCCYEAGYEGFWLYRRLAAAGLRVLVIDPSSLLVNRRAKRAKTDRIDAKAMIRALMAYNRGEDQVLSAVNVPSVEQGGPPSARSGTTELGLRLHRAYQPHSGTAADTRDRRLRPARQRR